MAARLTMIIPTLVQGGAEKQMSLLAAGLPRDQFDVSVCVLTHSGPWEAFLKEQGIAVEVIGKRFKADPIAFGKLVRYLRKTKPDLVHTWIFAANCYGRAAARLARIPHIVAGERCVDLWKSEGHFWLDRKLESSTDAIVTNSNGVVDFYVDHGLSREKFRVIPNGIADLANAPTDQNTGSRTTARAKWLAKLGLPDDAILALSLARLWPQKRLKDAIWALDLVNCTAGNLHLIVAGEGPERERLEEFARETGTEKEVHFVGHQENCSELLQIANMFVLPSEYEGQSNALMEAIQNQIPAVVSDIPGNRDLIPDDSYGLLFRTGDRAGLAKAMRQVVEQPQAAASRAVKAQERLASEFSLSRMIESYRQLYHDLLGN